jgi:hypothetical protein
VANVAYQRGSTFWFPWKALPMISVQMNPGAEDNGLACMLSTLLQQNLVTKPHKMRDFRKMHGAVAIVADDADVSLTMRFDGHGVVVDDGIVGLPDVTVRGSADVIMSLSNIPVTPWFGLPLPNPRDAEQVALMKTLALAMQSGSFHSYGMWFHLPLMLRMTRVLSIHG